VANRVYQGLPLARQTQNCPAGVKLICACIWCTSCGGDLDWSGAQLSLVMVFSERHAPRAQDVVRC